MTVDVFGQENRLLFFNQENGVKRLLTAALIVALSVLRWSARALSRLVQRGVASERARFWTRQAINLGITLLLLLGVLSIWFDDPTRLATGIGLVTAGLAFALQKVITAVAGGLEDAGIGLASATVEVVGVPPLRVAPAERLG